MTKILVQPNARVSDLQLPGETHWDTEVFEAFCQVNPGVDAELDAEGNLILLSRSNANADGRNTEFVFQLMAWNRSNPDFKTFGPSAGFTLSNGAVRSPDASLLRTADWEALSAEEQNSFPGVELFFAMELRSSASDPLSVLQAKMREYLDCGTTLAWLIDPVTSDLTVYRPGCEPVMLHAPTTVEAGDELPGFAVDFTKIW